MFIPFHIPWLSCGNNDSKSIAIIAHRGASGVAPENTLPAIDSALASMADYIEVDVCLSNDKRVIVIHDQFVDRTTNGNGKVSELNWEYIKTLDAGEWFGEAFKGTGVPLLEDVINRVNGKSKLLIEIKRGDHEGIEDEVGRLIKTYNAEEWCVVQSFSDESLKKLHNSWPEIELHKLFVFKFRILPLIYDGNITYFNFEKYNFVKAFNFHQRFGNAAFLRKIHTRGKKANAWGCSARGSCKVENMGIWDGLITDHPEDYK